MSIEFGGKLGLWKRIELVEEQDCRGVVVAAAALHAELVADLSAGDQDALGVFHAGIGHNGKESRLGKILDGRGRFGAPQHALRREHDERFAPQALRLAPQQMEILRRAGGLADLNVVFGGDLQEALDTRAGVLRSLAFEAMGKQKHHARRQVPFVLARANELVDDHLRAVGEISELRFPQHQRLGKIAAEAVFEAETSRFGKRGIVDFAPGLLGRKVLEREILFFRFRVHQRRVALVERAAHRVLPAEPYRSALEKERAERQRLGEAIIHGALSMAHLRALLEKLLHFRVDVKTPGRARQCIGNFGELFERHSGIHLVGRVVAPAFVGGPVIRQFAKRGNLLQRLGNFLARFVFGANLLDGLGRFRCRFLCVNLPELRVILDLLIEQRLSDGGVVHFAVAVTAVTDDVHNDVARKGVAILGREAADANHGGGIFPVDVEDGHGLPLGEVRSEAGRM